MAYDLAHDLAKASQVPTLTSSGDIEARLVTSNETWRSLMRAAPFGHLPQDASYAAGKEASGWPARRLLFLQAGKPVAFAVVLEFRRLGLKLFNRVNRGPVFLEADPGDDCIVGVYRSLRRHAGHLWTMPLLIASALPRGEASSALMRRAGFIERHPSGWRSARIDLTLSEDEVWKSFGSTFRNRVRAAEKTGAALRVGNDAEAFEWMIARHLENMRAKQFDAVGPELLRGLRAAAPENVAVFQMLHKGEPVAGMSVVRFGHTAEYHIGWFGPEGRRLNAGNFLMWNVMREMKRRGVTSFDVGGMKEGDGYTQFKRTMKPVEYELAGEWLSI